MNSKKSETIHLYKIMQKFLRLRAILKTKKKYPQLILLKKCLWKYLVLEVKVFS